MERVELSASFGWTSAGNISLDSEQKIRFPKTASRPGLYRFEIASQDGRAHYIGETDQLPRRLQHYRTPGPSQRTNIRLNALLIHHLKRGDQVSLSVVLDGVTVTCDGELYPVDLNRKSERILLENAALLGANATGIKLLNL
jgi:hypothetical protein